VVRDNQADSSATSHTGNRETAEDKAYWKVIPVRRRGWTLLSSTSTRWPFCGAVENAARMRRCPTRPNTSVWNTLGTEPDSCPTFVWPRHQRADLGAMSNVLVLLPRARDDPRPVRASPRASAAHALLPQVGGVNSDIRSGSEAKLREFIAIMPTRVDQYNEPAQAQTKDLLQRLRTPATLDEEIAARGWG